MENKKEGEKDADGKPINDVDNILKDSAEELTAQPPTTTTGEREKEQLVVIDPKIESHNVAG